MQFIDLSLPIIDKANEPQAARIQRINHLAGAKHAAREENFHVNSDIKPNFTLDENSFPNKEFLSYEIVETGVHTGTHIDAPYHYGSTCENKVARFISDVPLKYFFGKGLKLDVRNRENQDEIMVEDLKKAFSSTNASLEDDTIVLIQTGFDKYFGKDKYYTEHPGLSLDALKWLLSFGVKTIGLDTFSFDKPFKKMVSQYTKDGNAGNLWPVHFFGRQKEYYQIESLGNLDAIPVSSGFWVSCFPIKIHNVGAGWVRAVAFYDKEKSLI